MNRVPLALATALFVPILANCDLERPAAPRVMRPPQFSLGPRR